MVVFAVTRWSCVGLSELMLMDYHTSLMYVSICTGTGKNAGDRHPKVEGQVLIGAGTTVLGNITIGRGAQVAANSLVLKPVPPKTMVAGSPAREVGKVTGEAFTWPCSRL
jgi:serine O-acetyltransferase